MIDIQRKAFFQFVFLVDLVLSIVPLVLVSRVLQKKSVLWTCCSLSVLVLLWSFMVVNLARAFNTSLCHCIWLLFYLALLYNYRFDIPYIDIIEEICSQTFDMLMARISHILDVNGIQFFVYLNRKYWPQTTLVTEVAAYISWL